MVVVADTSPLNYRVLIGHAEVLSKLYGEVVIPRAVFRELQHPKTPPAVVAWIAVSPKWLIVRQEIPSLSELPTDLDPGESEAIALAQVSLPDVLLLMDEEKGRREAKRRGIQTAGKKLFADYADSADFQSA